MLTSLISLVEEKSSLPALDFLLSKLIETFPSDISTFADCGAGIGSSAVKYSTLLSKHSPAKVICYEPLPENLLELAGRLKHLPNIEIRPVAVGKLAGQATFSVPRRMTGPSAIWGPGTSATGYIGERPGLDNITVDVVRLGDEPYPRFDFIKMDLQGGEADALEGLGNKAQHAKMLFVEQQLLGGPEAPEPMSLKILHDLGFVCFYDEIQFGLVSTISEIPIRLFEIGGMKVTKILMPNGRGLPFSGRAVFTAKRSEKLSATGTFEPGFIRELKGAGVPWMATDIIAINRSIMPVFATWF